MVPRPTSRRARPPSPAGPGIPPSSTHTQPTGITSTSRFNGIRSGLRHTTAPWPVRIPRPASVRNAVVSASRTSAAFLISTGHSRPSYAGGWSCRPAAARSGAGLGIGPRPRAKSLRPPASNIQCGDYSLRMHISRIAAVRQAPLRRAGSDSCLALCAAGGAVSSSASRWLHKLGFVVAADPCGYFLTNNAREAV